MKREVREELGIAYAGGQLLVIDWVSPHGPWDDSLMFIFDGGFLDADRQTEITLQDRELNAWRFWTPEESAKVLRPYVWSRTEAALRAQASGVTAYLHDGRLLDQ